MLTNMFWAGLSSTRSEFLPKLTVLTGLFSRLFAREMCEDNLKL